MPNGNGNGKNLALWILGIVVPLVAAGGGHLVSEIKAHSERIAVLEAEIVNVNRHLEAIERKLDRLIEQGNRR
jgi:hypothetical protein